MKKWLMIFSISILISCSTEINKNQQNNDNFQPIVEKSTPIDSAIDSISGNCGQLGQNIDIQFAYISQAEIWIFYVFLKKKSQSSEIEWIKICTEFAFFSLAGIATNGVFYAILNENNFMKVLEAFKHVDFFNLPERISNEYIIPSAPIYQIKASKSEKIHEVELVLQELSQYQAEKDRFLKLWDTFFQLLPLKPPKFE